MVGGSEVMRKGDETRGLAARLGGANLRYERVCLRSIQVIEVEDAGVASRGIGQ